MPALRSPAQSADASAVRPAGFTLIELVLVLLLLAIMSAMVMPSVRGFLSGSRGRDAISQVVSLAQYAKAKAAADAKAYRLNVEGGTYWLTMQEGEAYVPTGTDLGRHFTLPQGARIEVVPGGLGGQVDPRGVTFLPNGRTSRGVVKLTEANGHVTLIGSPSPAEAFRVLSAEEAARI